MKYFGWSSSRSLCAAQHKNKCKVFAKLLLCGSLNCLMECVYIIWKFYIGMAFSEGCLLFLASSLKKRHFIILNLMVLFITQHISSSNKHILTYVQSVGDKVHLQRRTILCETYCLSLQKWVPDQGSKPWWRKQWVWSNTYTVCMYYNL